LLVNQLRILVSSMVGFSWSGLSSDALHQLSTDCRNDEHYGFREVKISNLHGRRRLMKYLCP
jgi:hypothetical protein